MSVFHCILHFYFRNPTLFVRFNLEVRRGQPNRSSTLCCLCFAFGPFKCWNRYYLTPFLLLCEGREREGGGFLPTAPSTQFLILCSTIFLSQRWTSRETFFLRYITDISLIYVPGQSPLLLLRNEEESLKSGPVTLSWRGEPEMYSRESARKHSQKQNIFGNNS